MTYEEYIGSSDWHAKRQERLEFDGHKCVICHSEQNLSVHHLHYETMGQENVQHDLVTLCPNHHHLFDGLERWRRYSLRQRTITPIESTVSIRQEISYGMANSEVSVEVRAELPATYAQRTNSRPPQQVVETDEADQWQAEQDRRRLRRNGTA